jgi:hypothetical protein
MEEKHQFEQELEAFDADIGLLDFKFMPRFVSEATPDQFLDDAFALLTSDQTEEFQIPLNGKKSGLVSRRNY